VTGSPASAADPFTLLFMRARVVDGSGAPAFVADVATRGARIAAVGELGAAPAARVIDARGLVLSPGFIDVHAHSDLPLLADPANEPKLQQGITTELLGADGLSYAPLVPALLEDVRRYLAGLYGNPPVEIPGESVAALLARLDRRTSSNTVYVVPHQALRLMARGWRGGPATADELDAMRDLLERGLTEGARGLGTGLDYFPHGTCTTHELIELSRVVARHDGVLVSHVRYWIGVVDAVREMVEVAAASGVRVLISHLRTAEALPVIDEARARGLDIQFDTYPYNAGSSLFLMYLPFWAHEGGPAELLRRLRDPRDRARLRAERHPRLSAELDTIVISSVGTTTSDALRGYEGRSLAWIMEARDVSDPVDAVCDLLLATDLAAGFVAQGGTEESLRACIAHPAHLASTDAVLVGSRLHPRAYGTYPRYLGRYVRELGLLGLEECIRRMTSAPAACLGLADRGLVQPGLAADLVLFDAQRVVDRATFESPQQTPLGIELVVVNGEVVVAAGRHTGALPGRALRGSAIHDTD
jgi:N-acyl-D-amino-acid deacylase